MRTCMHTCGCVNPDSGGGRREDANVERGQRWGGKTPESGYLNLLGGQTPDRGSQPHPMDHFLVVGPSCEW